MGEIVDLQSYRRRRKRRAAAPQGGAGRRSADRVQPRRDGPRTVGESPEPGRGAPEGGSKVGRDDQKAD